MPRVEYNLAELMVTEHVEIPELIEALQQYVSAKGIDLEPVADLIRPFSRQCAENLCDYVFGWLRKEVDSNLESTTTLRRDAEVKDRYLLTSKVNGHEFSNEIDLTDQIVAELLRNTNPDGSKIEIGRPFASKIIVQLYADYREAIIDAHTTGTVNSLVEFYATPVKLIAEGSDVSEVSAYFEKAKVASEARRKADWEGTMASYNEAEIEEYERFYANQATTLKP